jgi:phosphatidate cytidylyltransferase
VAWTVVAVVAVLSFAGIAMGVLRWTRKIGDESWQDLYLRWRSWTVISVLVLVPTLLGAAWTVAAVALLSLACYYEYARVVGLRQERIVNAVVVFGILLVTFAVVDHYERLFFAAGPLTVVLLAVATIPADRPQGYIRRVGLAAFGFLMFGLSLGYVGNFANVADLGNGVDYRPIVLMILAGVALNDVFAYCVGKSAGGTKLLPNTSPGKTVAGSVGALALASPMIAFMGHCVFRGTPVDTWPVLWTLGVGISGLGQLGDLVVSSIKRDVGIKDMGQVIPGHGGLLDRFDSLILVPPALFHYLSIKLGPLAAEEPARIISGGGGG